MWKASEASNDVMVSGGEINTVSESIRQRTRDDSHQLLQTADRLLLDGQILRVLHRQVEYQPFDGSQLLIMLVRHPIQA